jgi:hypothetical protein
VASANFVRRLLAAGAAAAAVAAVVFGAGTAMAENKSDVPAVIAPPAGSVKVATYRVEIGYQIYKCSSGVWSLKAPGAMLLNKNDDDRAIYHSAGPTWQSMTDGSLVTAFKKAESPVPGAIPQLLLEVNSHGGTAAGELSNVSHIQRLNTKNGLAPTGSCVDGAEQPVKYGADYVFWAPAA